MCCVAAQHVKPLRIRVVGEPDLERHVFSAIVVRIESDCVDGLIPKGRSRLRCRGRIDRYRHHRGAGAAGEQIHVAQVQPRILPGGRGVEMMRQRLCLPVQSATIGSTTSSEDTITPWTGEQLGTGLGSHLGWVRIVTPQPKFAPVNLAGRGEGHIISSSLGVSSDRRIAPASRTYRTLWPSRRQLADMPASGVARSGLRPDGLRRGRFTRRSAQARVGIHARYPPGVGLAQHPRRDRSHRDPSTN